MLASFGNLFDAAPGDRRQEVVTSLLDTPNLKIERNGSSPWASAVRRASGTISPGRKWVIVLAGSAGLCFEGEAEARVLSPGGYVLIPARLQDRATIWLAVHYPETK